MRALIACLLLVLAMPATAMDGVDVGKPSAVRNLVPAGALEKQADLAARHHAPAD